MNFRNNSQIKNINKGIADLERVLSVMESGSASLDDLILAKPEMIKILEFLSVNIDTLNREALKKDSIVKIDSDVANLVDRYNKAKTKVKYAHGNLVDYTVTDDYMMRFDRKSSNELEISNSPATQKVLHKKRVGAVVRNSVALALVVTLLGSAVFHGINHGLLKDDLADANSQIVQLQDEKTELEAKILILVAEISELEDKLKNPDLSAEERAQYEAAIELLEQEKQEALDKIEELTEENAGFKAQVEKLQSELQKSNALVESLKKQLEANPGDATLKAQLAEALAQNEVLAAQVETLTIENKELKGKLTTLNNNYNSLKAENKKLDEANSALISENAGLKTQIKNLNSTISGLEATIDELNKDIGNLASALSVANAEIARLQGIINSGNLSDAERAKYEAQIKTLTENNVKLEGQLAAKTQEYSTLLGKYNQVIEEKDALVKENAGLKNEVASFEELKAFIDNYYLETMGNAGNGMAPVDKVIALFAYYTQTKPTSVDYQKLEAVYSFLTQVYGPGEEIYQGLSLEEFRAILDQIAGGLQAPPSDAPTNGNVHEDEKETGSGSGSTQPGQDDSGSPDTEGRLPGDF